MWIYMGWRYDGSIRVALGWLYAVVMCDRNIDFASIVFLLDFVPRVVFCFSFYDHDLILYSNIWLLLLILEITMNFSYDPLKYYVEFSFFKIFLINLKKKKTLSIISEYGYSWFCKILFQTYFSFVTNIKWLINKKYIYQWCTQKNRRRTDTTIVVEVYKYTDTTFTAQCRREIWQNSQTMINKPLSKKLKIDHEDAH